MTKPALQIEARSHGQAAIIALLLLGAIHNLNLSFEIGFTASALLLQSWIIEVHRACHAVGKPPIQSAR